MSNYDKSNAAYLKYGLICCIDRLYFYENRNEFNGNCLSVPHEVNLLIKHEINRLVLSKYLSTKEKDFYIKMEDIIKILDLFHFPEDIKRYVKNDTSLNSKETRYIKVDEFLESIYDEYNDTLNNYQIKDNLKYLKRIIDMDINDNSNGELLKNIILFYTYDLYANNHYNREITNKNKTDIINKINELIVNKFKESKRENIYLDLNSIGNIVNSVLYDTTVTNTIKNDKVLKENEELLHINKTEFIKSIKDEYYEESIKENKNQNKINNLKQILLDLKVNLEEPKQYKKN